MSSSLTATGSGGDKKAAGSHSIISSLKRFVSDVGNNNGIGNTTSATSECREELDGVERGEGAPLSHLTASRAKAPRRRPPSSQHLRHHATESSVSISWMLELPPSVTSTLLVLEKKNNINFIYQLVQKSTLIIFIIHRRITCLMDALKHRWSKYRMKKQMGLW